MKQLLFLFLLISIKSFPQSIEIGNTDNITRNCFYEEKEQLYVFQKDSFSIIDINKLEEISKKEITYPSEIFVGRFIPVSINSGIYFTNEYGGEVYKFEDENFIRIDNSFGHRMQMSAPTFTFNNIIYKYGGYGFWSMRDFFTYYDTNTNEWEVISPSGSKVKPKGTQRSSIDIKDETFYVYGGQSLDEFELNQILPNEEVWEFNITTKSWKLLGKCKIHFNDYFNFSYGDKRIFYTDQVEDLFLVDVFNNKIKTYKKQNFQYSFYGSNTLYKNGMFYCIIKNYSTGDLSLIKIEEDEFFGELTGERKFYYNNEKLYYSVGIIFLIAILILVFLQVKKYVQKLNRIVVHKNRFVYKRNILSFDNKSSQILILLLKSDEDVPSNSILNIVENKELNHGHNTRVKNNLIDDINLKLKSVLRIKNDIITSHKSELDKRIKVYHIDKSYFYIK